MALGRRRKTPVRGPPRASWLHCEKHYKDRRKESAVCSHRFAAHAGIEILHPFQIESHPHNPPAQRRSLGCATLHWLVWPGSAKKNASPVVFSRSFPAVRSNDCFQRRDHLPDLSDYHRAPGFSKLFFRSPNHFSRKEAACFTALLRMIDPLKPVKPACVDPIALRR